MKEGAIRIYAKNGGVVVERLYAGTVIDRYKTNQPELPRKKDDWSAQVCEWFRKPETIVNFKYAPVPEDMALRLLPDVDGLPSAADLDAVEAEREIKERME